MSYGYSILDHPADLGIEATGPTAPAAFENAATALMSIILDLSGVVCRETREIEINASDHGQLLVNWLTEILYLYDGQHFVAKEFTVRELTGACLKASVAGEPFSPGRHRTKLDVKAVTYHQLLIEQNTGGVLVRVFLDI